MSKARDLADLLSASGTLSYTQLSNKPDLTLKADVTALNSGLATKADDSATTTALGLKADTTTVNSALTLKANSGDLATVATSGDYDDLTDQPSIPDTFDDLTGALPAVDGSSLTGISSAPVVDTGGATLPNTGSGQNAVRNTSCSYSLSGFTNGGTCYINLSTTGENMNTLTVSVSGTGISNVGYATGGNVNVTKYAWFTFTGNPSGTITLTGQPSGQAFFADGNCSWIAIGI